MSSKLAHFLIHERFPKTNFSLSIPEVRFSVDELIGLLFPQRGCFSELSEHDIVRITENLKKQFTLYFKALSPIDPKLTGSEEQKAQSFLDQLESLSKELDLDAKAAYQGDPAAYSLEEVILSYPGFYAVCVYRLAHALVQLDIPLLPRLMSEYAHEKTGIDIHPGARIGESFFIDHGTGVVIGETSIIGKNVKIYQGVTLGALSVKKTMQTKKRHPTIEDDVVIYANATILGGETIVGKGSTLGGNIWITESVPAGSTITLTGK
jgi:serine O-acetyltransferase